MRRWLSMGRRKRLAQGEAQSIFWFCFPTPNMWSPKVRSRNNLVVRWTSHRGTCDTPLYGVAGTCPWKCVELVIAYTYKFRVVSQTAINKVAPPSDDTSMVQQQGGDSELQPSLLQLSSRAWCGFCPPPNAPIIKSTLRQKTNSLISHQRCGNSRNQSPRLASHG